MLGLIAGCVSAGGAAPVFDPVGDQEAVVGRELRMELSASDADGDLVTFDFRTPSRGFALEAELRTRPDGSALLAWLPTAADVGDFTVDLVASDGAHHTVESIHVVVRASESRPPKIIEPRNAGTLFRPTSEQPCLTIEFEVQHHDEVEIIVTRQPDHATIAQDREGLGAVWRWCPTDEQLEAGGRHSLAFYATDGELESAPRTFVIILESDRIPDPSCTSSAPVISHQPVDQAAVSIVIEATIVDDEGVKQAFVCVGSTTGSVEELCASTVAMSLKSGSPQEGTWTAEVPNPREVESNEAIDSLAYFVVAQDSDGDEGECSHNTVAPNERAPYVVSLTDDRSTPAYCAPCQTDSECPDGMACVQGVRSDGQHACVFSCSASGADEECEGSVCSVFQHATADWSFVYECMPPGGATYCDGSPQTSTCTPDNYESNDTRLNATPITPGTASARLCPGDAEDGEEDYYRIELDSPARIDLRLQGPAASDLDLELVSSRSGQRWHSFGIESNEQITQCVEAGAYDIRVFSIRNQPKAGTDYTLDFTLAPCTCVPDAAEPDDTDEDARLVIDVRSGHTETNQTICPGDSDWYYVGLLAAGRSLHASLAFEQASRDQDLDVELWRADDNGTLEQLVPCLSSPGNDCSNENGQSGTPNERLDWNVRALGEYFIVVTGFLDSENTYDICIGDAPSTCPLP